MNRWIRLRGGKVNTKKKIIPGDKKRFDILLMLDEIFTVFVD